MRARAALLNGARDFSRGVRSYDVSYVCARPRRKNIAMCTQFKVADSTVYKE